MKMLKALVTLRTCKVIIYKRGAVRTTTFQTKAGSPLLAQNAVRRDHPGCRIVSLKEVFVKGPKQTERVGKPTRASGIWGNPYAMRVSRVISGGLPSLGKRR